MRLRCELPAGWTLVDERRWQRDGAELTIEITPPVLRTDPESTFLREAIVGAADPASVRVGARTRERSGRGWPIEVLQVAIVAAGQLVEGRVVFVFELLQHRAALRVSARPPTLLTVHHAEIMAIVSSARPDWTSDDIIALAQLWR